MEVAVKSVTFFLLSYFSYYFVLRFVQSLFTGFLGSINPKLSKFMNFLNTPAHELAHLLVCLLCGAKIEQVQLLPDSNSSGFVKSKIEGKYQFIIIIKEFFVAIAPVIINVPLFIILEKWVVLKGDISRILYPGIIFTKEGFITVLLFLVLLSGIAPSNTDLKRMFKGLMFFCIIIFIFSYLSSMVFDVMLFNIAPILTIIIYYIEVIVVLLILNVIINYNNCLNIIKKVLMNALKYAFEWK